MGNCPIFSLCRNFSSPPAAGALLDRIVSQSEKTDREVPLYALADYRKGGSLVEAYRRGGSKEVERIALEELKPFLYNDGQGKTMPTDAYDQWKRRNNNNHEVAINIEPNHVNCQQNEKFGSANNYNHKTPDEKKICWKLEFRGLLGETVLHVLILCNTPVHTRIARTLLKVYPALAWDIIEGDEYHGASALHLAIAYHSSDLVTKLIDCGTNVTQRAKGRFFLPFDQQLAIPKKTSDFEGLCYLGEYPLAWAACCEDETSYNLLLSKGADPNARDTFGNMILHMVVIQDKLTMYGYALRHPTKPAKDGILNRFGLTPLTLACKLGRNKIFREMLELSALEFWRYSNITCSGYPLNALDTILPSGKTNWNSALMIILNGTTDEHLDMLDGGVIQRLLEEKWKTFARGQFLKRLALMFLHLLVLSIAVFLRPNDEEPLLKKLDETEGHDICRYCAEIGTCLGCIGFVFFQQVEEIMAQGLLGFLLNLSSNPTKAIFLVSNVMVLMCIPCRVAGHRYMEDLLLSIALPGSWFFLIFFAGAVRLTGPFVTMIYNMLVGDMFRFSIIYFIFLLAFTQAFYFLKKVPNDENSKSFTGYLETWMYLFHMTLGEYEYKELGDNYYRGLTQVVFALFMILTPILLLNMLIAMMGNTYCVVITQSEREWMRQWAKIVVALERAVSQKMALDFMHIYSIKLPSSGGDADDPEKEIRAVMVIKSKNKTKARQRKGALMNWKRLGKKIIVELRQNGGSADVLRQKLFSNTNVAAKTTRRRPDNADDFECHESPGGPPKADGLGKALNQLAFAHDWDLSALNTGAEAEEEEEEPKTPKANFGEVFEKITWLNDLDVLNQEGRQPNGSPPATGTSDGTFPPISSATSLPPSNTILNGVINNSIAPKVTNNDIGTSLVSQVAVATPNGKLPNQERVPVQAPVMEYWTPEEVQEMQRKTWYINDSTPPPAYQTPSDSLEEPDVPDQIAAGAGHSSSQSSRARLNATSGEMVDSKSKEAKKEEKKAKKKKKCKKLKKSKVGIEITPSQDLPPPPEMVFNQGPEEELPSTSSTKSGKSRKKSGKHHHRKLKHLSLEEVGLHQIDECSEEDKGLDNQGYARTPIEEAGGWTPGAQRQPIEKLFNDPPEPQPISVSKVGPRKVQAMSSLVAWDEPPDQ